mmetsp:Transcript_31634/g.50502  ORF Transcript_31634/g.50502 Transcript_31634/m.50502 type:complete len:794 (+) Transcript_31634:290-2671(+)|eukprot:CAMPEP_0203760940 /NCGR_PEP_ID=MMETSP0098-20131031/14122_1 /ASSEMBLY_ACC=CAM_ASM_000208 /TAXON_ID=96639 /ORGANISM=" , Strain NY0313808BC1" /LENGTH=793 /DNA_ID=CAMNT_0050654713 /DNA_START=216 /DNA_END=2597 /DNA_ORIENTATION=+
MGKHGGVDNSVPSKDEAPLQAVVLADSFERKFRPITLETPKALLPLVNVPMIEYTLEFLAESNVKEIFVFCGWMAEKVESYLNQSRWATSTSPVVRIMKFKHTSNACSALRELDQIGVLNSDPFVLVSGDVVSNIKLDPIIKAHKARRKKDKNHIMTMLFSRVDPLNNRVQVLPEELLVAMDGETKQILKYENNLDVDCTRFDNGEIFDYHPTVEFRYNLLDCNIDICSPEMVLQIAENYDYQDLRRDYIRNEVQNEIGYRITAHELTSPSDYACRVMSLRQYDAISKDIVRRWLYPLVPDVNWWSETSQYRFERGFRYCDRNIKTSRTSSIGENTVVASGCEIGDGSKLISCVLGENCKIGSNVTISNSYLWDNVVVEDNAVIESSVLCQGVFIRQGAKVLRGSVLASGVTLGVGIATKPFARITTVVHSAKDEDEDDSDSDFGDFSDEEDDNVQGGSIRGSVAEQQQAVDTKLVGEDGIGLEYKSITSQLQRMVNVPKWAVDSFNNVLEQNNSLSFTDASNSIECTELETARRSVWKDFNTFHSDDEDSFGEIEHPDAKFLRGVADFISVADTLGGAIEHDNVLLELKSYKAAEDRSLEDLIFAVVPVIMSAVPETGISKEDYKEGVKEQLTKWKPTLEELCSNSETERSLVSAIELTCLYGSEQAAAIGLATQAGVFNPDEYNEVNSDVNACTAFPFIITHIYSDLDLVSSNSIMLWKSRHTSARIPNTILNAPVTGLVIDQICDQDSDSSSSDGSSSDSDSDSSSSSGSSSGSDSGAESDLDTSTPLED